MLITKTPQDRPRIYLKNHPISRVSEYKYLGTTINENNDSSEEVRIRIDQARSTFVIMKRLFYCRDLSLLLKVRLMRYFVLFVMYYLMEAWTQKIIDVERLKSFEMLIRIRISENTEDFVGGEDDQRGSDETYT